MYNNITYVCMSVCHVIDDVVVTSYQPISGWPSQTWQLHLWTESFFKVTLMKFGLWAPYSKTARSHHLYFIAYSGVATYAIIVGWALCTVWSII